MNASVWCKFRAEAVFKIRLTPNYGVVPNFEMLTYSRVRSALKIRDALSLDVIQTLNTASESALPGGLMLFLWRLGKW